MDGMNRMTKMTNAAAARVIFVILFILSIPLLPFPHLAGSRHVWGAMRLGVAMPIRRGAESQRVSGVSRIRCENCGSFTNCFARSFTR